VGERQRDAHLTPPTNTTHVAMRARTRCHAHTHHTQELVAELQAQNAALKTQLSELQATASGHGPANGKSSSSPSQPSSVEAAAAALQASAAALQQLVGSLQHPQRAAPPPSVTAPSPAGSSGDRVVQLNVSGSLMPVALSTLRQVRASTCCGWVVCFVCSVCVGVW
jgi:hypothetical protein